MRASKIFVLPGTGLVLFAIACGGKVAADDSCGPFIDALVAMDRQCGVQEPANPGARAAFVAYCGALASAPGAKDLEAQYAACTKNLDPNICAGPQCGPRGTLAAGAACTDGAQCQSGSCMPTGPAGPNTEQSCGTCAQLVEQGGSCNAPNVICDVYVGLSCSDTDQTCQPLPACGNGAICGNDSFCDGQSCQPLPTKGQPCTTTCTPAYACIGNVCSDRLGPGSPCPAGNECVLDDICNPVTHVCSAKVAAGVSCGIPPDYNACDDGLVCTGGSHVCEAPKPLGASCVVGNLECAPGLWCANGTCQLPDFTICK